MVRQQRRRSCRFRRGYFTKLTEATFASRLACVVEQGLPSKISRFLLPRRGVQVVCYGNYITNLPCMTSFPCAPCAILLAEMIERYTTPEMRDLWSEEGKFRAWLEVEIAICEGLAQYGYIPADAPAAIRERARFDIERIAELEQETRHDVMAFVRNLAENVGEAGRWIHYGVTSYDVVDTALALRLKKSVELVLTECDALQTEIRRLALEHLRTPMIGRTHGVHAEPITFGFKLLGWYAEMDRHLQRLERLRSEVSVGKVSGAVGIHANVDPRVEEYV
ncbi:MAG: lyase family protein, partial [Fimbriimonadales bacterium]|nr:lyase family protein [Fimbriimonadales bacterium]